MHPLILENRGATIRRRSVPLRLGEIRVPATDEIRAYRSVRRDHASNAFLSMAPMDDGRHVSSVAPLTICGRINVPTLFQSLADLGLCESLLLRKIFTRVAWLP